MRSLGNSIKLCDTGAQRTPRRLAVAGRDPSERSSRDFPQGAIQIRNLFHRGKTRGSTPPQRIFAGKSPSIPVTGIIQSICYSLVRGMAGPDRRTGPKGPCPVRPVAGPPLPSQTDTGQHPDRPVPSGMIIHHHRSATPQGNPPWRIGPHEAPAHSSGSVPPPLV